MQATTRELGQRTIEDYLQKKLAEWDQWAKSKAAADRVRLVAGSVAADEYQRGDSQCK